MFEMNGITPESLVEPIEFGVGEITLDRLGMTPESSPFHEPSQEPDVSEPNDEPNYNDSESVSSPFEAETLKAEIVSRTTQGFEKGMKYLVDNPKIVGLILLVGFGSYFLGKRK